MRVPKYRKHSQGIGFVEWQGKRHYLPGSWDSFESRTAYRQFLRENVFGEQVAVADKLTDGAPVIVAVVASGFLDEAMKRYGPDIRGEYANVEYAMVYWSEHSGEVRVTEFGPKRLKAYREWRLSKGDSTAYVNSQVNRIKRALRWAVSEELIPASVVVGLETVNGLAADTVRREAVAWEHVEAILPHVNRVIAAMVLLQWYTAVRSRSLCQAEPRQFDCTQQPWLWRPVHKTERTRKTPLVIPVGPRAQAAVGEFFDRDDDAPLFDPQEIRRNPRYGNRYKPNSYRQAILRGIDRANEVIREQEIQSPTIPHWFPYQLRHTRGRLVRAAYGVEAAQGILGHESLDATEIYTTRLLTLASQAALDMG